VEDVQGEGIKSTWIPIEYMPKSNESSFFRRT
jgi:hypothetical protein